jgi:hypothetical protein
VGWFFRRVVRGAASLALSAAAAYVVKRIRGGMKPGSRGPAPAERSPTSRTSPGSSPAAPASAAGPGAGAADASGGGPVGGSTPPAG